MHVFCQSRQSLPKFPLCLLVTDVHIIDLPVSMMTHDSLHDTRTACRQTVQVTGLYLMMGRALERLSAAPAGNVVAIGGLEEAVLKSATITTTPAAPPLAPVEHQADAIVQVQS